MHSHEERAKAARPSESSESVTAYEKATDKSQGCMEGIYAEHREI